MRYFTLYLNINSLKHSMYFTLIAHLSLHWSDQVLSSDVASGHHGGWHRL